MKPLFTLAFLALPAFAAFPNGYNYCKVVTTQHTMVSGTNDLTNYPLTVILTDTDLRTVGNGGLVNNGSGYDIGFYPDCSGSGAALKWEIESYSATTGAIVAHILRPTLSHTVDDTVGMFYGGAFGSFQSTVSAVWDTYYRGVWHLGNGTTLSAVDSTAHAHNGTVSGTTTADTGVVDGGALIGSAGIPVVDSTDYNVSNITISAWALTASDVALSILDRDDQGSGHREFQFRAYANQLQFIPFLGGSPQTITSIGYLRNPSIFHYVVATWDGTTERLYIDGVLDNSATPSGTLNSGTGAVLTIGASAAGGQVFIGDIDEVRISDIARPADWILTEYRNQSAPGTYISAGPRITPGASGARVRHVVSGGA